VKNFDIKIIPEYHVNIRSFLNVNIYVTSRAPSLVSVADIRII